jgi:lipoprotein-anchoring transpeptidase ErfK/SrfK
LGELQIAKKTGDGAVSGTVFKDRRPTGEVLVPDAPGRDPIVSRILWLRGLESQNANAYGRYIYIHGTAEERNIGKRASYGCIRMRSRDVIQLYDVVGWGARVTVVDAPLITVVPAAGGPDSSAVSSR